MAEILHFINRDVKQLKLKAMKKVVVISLMSLLFLATFAQRPSKSRSTEENDYDRNKSVNDKIVYTKTEVHKNMEPHTGYNANSGRNHSINSRTYDVERKNYHTPDRNPSHRVAYHVNKPKPVEYRRIYYPYVEPYNIHVIWTPRMYHEYMMIYPDYGYWYYPNGYRIRTISAYDAMYYIGEVVNVYGRVYETWYSRETDEYFLHFGARYPYQDFSIVIRGNKARQFSRRPEKFFEGRHIWVTGLISLNQGQPEMIVRKKHQIHLY